MGTQYEAQLELQNKVVTVIVGAIRPWLIGFIILLVGFYTWWRKRKKNLA